MSDEWYDDMVRTAQAVEDEERGQRERDAQAELRAAGAGEGLEDYDLAGMKEAGVPMDGTMVNEHAKPGRKVVGRFEARDGNALGRSEMDIRLGGLQRAASEVGAMVGHGVYGFGAGIWNFSADVYEALGGDPEKSFRPGRLIEDYQYEGPTTLVGEVGSGAIKYGLGFGAAYSRLAALSSAPRTTLGAVTQTSTRAAASGAAADALILDPRYESLYTMFRELSGMESEVARAIDPAILYEDSPMAARASMAVEGAAMGAVMGSTMRLGGMAAGKAAGVARAVWQRADDLEQLSVQAMRRNRSKLMSGLDPQDVAWMGVWMGAKMMKGVQRLTAEMKETLADLGASPTQIQQAWDEAAMLNQKAAREQLEEVAGDLQPEVFQKLEAEAARFVVPEVAGETLPPELASKTAVNYFTGPSPAGKDLKTIAPEIQAQSREFVPEKLPQTPENLPSYAKLIAADVKTALGRTGERHGGAWYRDHADRARRLAALRYPDIMTDKGQESAFNFALAITSQGMDPATNGRLALQAFEAYRNTGRFPEEFVGGGPAEPVLRQAFKQYNRLADMFGEHTLAKLLDETFTVRELKQAGFKVSGELMDEQLAGSVIFGPKIGGAFYQNVKGNLEPVTMDKWWRRSWGRYSGEVVADAAKNQKYIDDFAAGLDPEWAAKWGVPEPEEFVKLRPEDKLHAMRTVYNYVAKPVDGKSFRPDRGKNHPAFKAARSLYKAMNPIEAMSGKDRQYMRAAMREAVQMLKSEGIEVEPADVQALLWFLEKDIYHHRGQRIDRSAFDDPLLEWAKSEGFPEDKIRRAVDGPRRGRGTGRGGRGDAGRGSGDGRRGSEGRRRGASAKQREAFLAAGAGE